MAEEGISIGIDLGTTNSCVAITHDGRPHVIPNAKGDRITPSCVAFVDNKILCGEAARKLTTTKDSNIIYNAKRLMGLNFNDVQKKFDVENWTFNVVDQENRPYIKVHQNGDDEFLPPQTISSIVIKEMIRIVEKNQNKKVTSAVITVPASFLDMQKIATVEAARLADIDMKHIHLLPEPVAAAMAFGCSRNLNDKSQIVFVFNFGGGTLDVSVLKIGNGLVQVLAYDGDPNLGGADFDKCLLDLVVARIKKDRPQFELTSDYHLELLHECEKAKRTFIDMDEVSLVIKRFFKDEDLSIQIEKNEFEEAAAELFVRMMEPIDAVLRAAQKDRSEVEQVLLIGGSTRIPKVEKLLEEFFGAHKICKKTNPDEAVAEGAAIQVAFLEDKVESIGGVKVVTMVTPRAYGIELKSGAMSPLIPRNTMIPTSFKKRYFTTRGDQTDADIRVFQGNEELCANNQLLLDFTVSNLQKAEGAKRACVIVTLTIDGNGFLTATAKDEETGTEVKMEHRNQIDLTEEQFTRHYSTIKRLLSDSIKIAEEKKQLEISCNQILAEAKHTKAKVKEILTNLSGSNLTLDYLIAQNHKLKPLIAGPKPEPETPPPSKKPKHE